jgi:CheY-like chemotaxis protein/tetratricopeptide (TPR) repeat protein
VFKEAPSYRVGYDGVGVYARVLAYTTKGNPHMNLVNGVNRQTDAVARCGVAAGFIHAGQYEAARDALGEFWQGIGQRPELKGLKPLAAAEVLLQCGSLSGWLGSVRQIPDAQERAKDLLSEALRKFRSQGQKSKVCEAQYELGMCYFRLGGYDDARVVLGEALAELRDEDAELKAKTLIRRTLVEVWTGRYHEALDILKEAQPFFEGVNDAIKGRWHGQMALVLRRMATAEGRADFADRAIIEYTAAAYHLERAGHERYCAVALNNLAFLLYKLGRYSESHENLDRAVQLVKRLKDDGLLAQVNETRARVLVAEKKYREADRAITESIQTLEKGEERALLSDALTIQGVVWANMGLDDDSIRVLRESLKVAIDSGATSNAAHAALALIEEHGGRLPEYELYRVYRTTDALLKDTQDAEDVARLRACARIVMKRLTGRELDDPTFTLKKAVLTYEARLIEETLRLEQGSVTRAAKRLGISYQTLGEILRARHQSLLSLRTALKPRRHSIIPSPNKPARRPKAKRPQTVTILHAEDNEAVANVVKDTLESKGWKVKTCADGITALRKLASKVRYDLLLLDNDLPGVNGLELTRTTRKLAHRRRTPIIMFSASEVETEAWKAGVDAFLRKPQEIGNLIAMATRLLSKGK